MRRTVLFSLISVITFSLLGCEKEEAPRVDFAVFEKYCEEYFAKNKQYRDFSRSIIDRTREFMAMNEGTKEFSGKAPFRIYPIYSLGVDGVAYYEVWFSKDGVSPAGWVLFSATDRDYPLVNFSHEGIPYSVRLADEARRKGVTIDSSHKTYRFGVSYFTLEDQDGNKIAEFGQMPRFVPKDIDLSKSGRGDSKSETLTIDTTKDTARIEEGVHYYRIQDYDDLKRYFAESYFTKRRVEVSIDMLERLFPKETSGEATVYLKTSGQYIYRWIGGTQCLYTQIQARTGFNHTGCWSGCNNNAWASLYGWWDINRAKSNLIPTTSTGEGCPTTRSTLQRRDVVDPVQMWFRGTCDTYCSGGGGWTSWSDAWKGYRWAANQGYGWAYWYRWCNSAGCNVELANILVDCIGNNYRPAHIGANSHFYVGTGLAQWSTNTDWTWVYCYPGWSENHNDDVWIYWKDLNSSTKAFVY